MTFTKYEKHMPNEYETEVFGVGTSVTVLPFYPPKKWEDKMGGLGGLSGHLRLIQDSFDCLCILFVLTWSILHVYWDLL